MEESITRQTKPSVNSLRTELCRQGTWMEIEEKTWLGCTPVIDSFEESAVSGHSFFGQSSFDGADRVPNATGFESRSRTVTQADEKISKLRLGQEVVFMLDRTDGDQNGLMCK
ncbi:hypothetical protein QJS04_geneDACA024594 [Acorus gramineus]|uniref:Uncharacterized protein n=1 Tax=Acorus gramineus TaxID=55184 RepID=A0AAV9A3N2_ACOGR|nr:hypothetical protein QJS04_geneDACA024594 [Acorus gramineus]